MNGDLAHLGAENRALDTNDIAEVPLLEFSVGVLANVVLSYIYLHSVGAVAQVDEACLAHDTACHHSACYCYVGVFKLLEAVADLLVGDSHRELCDGVGILACRLERCELLKSYTVLLVELLRCHFLVFGLGVLYVFVCHYFILPPSW